MKKLPKKPFEEFVEISRKFWETGDMKFAYERNQLAIRLERATGVFWLALVDLIDALLMKNGLNPDAELDEIYCVLRVSGWEVVDDGV